MTKTKKKADAAIAKFKKAMTPYTLGPWHATTGYCPQVKAGTTIIVSMVGATKDAIGGEQLSEITANARLIAAAPDLLETLKSIAVSLENLAEYTRGHETAYTAKALEQQANAAIAKAVAK